MLQGRETRIEGVPHLVIFPKGAPAKREQYIVSKPSISFTKDHPLIISVGFGKLSTPRELRRKGKAEALIVRLHETVFPALAERTGIPVQHFMQFTAKDRTPMRAFAKKLGFSPVAKGLKDNVQKMIAQKPSVKLTPEEEKIVDWLEKYTYGHFPL